MQHPQAATILKSASYSLAARWAIVSKVGCTSVGEPEITTKTSAVAVCCSNASRNAKSVSLGAR
jgi:hypothetical protein